MDQIKLRNRLLVATGMWKEATGEALPRLAPGDPETQIESFELHDLLAAKHQKLPRQ